LKPKGGRYSNTRLVKVYEPWLEYIGHQWVHGQLFHSEFVGVMVAKTSFATTTFVRGIFL
jgi:hypothetical protein